MQFSIRRNRYLYPFGVQFWPAVQGALYGKHIKYGWALDINLVLWTISIDSPHNPKGM